MENNKPKTCEEFVIGRLLKAEGDNFQLAMQISELEDENLHLKDENETLTEIIREIVKALQLYKLPDDSTGNWLGVGYSLIMDKCLVDAILKRCPELTAKEDN